MKWECWNTQNIQDDIVMKKIAENRTEQDLLHILQNEIPALEVKSSKLIADSWDNTVLEVNDEYIFRFSKDEEIPIETEVKVLRYLQGKLSFEIPEILFLGEEYKYMGYRKIVGKILSIEEVNTNILAQDIKKHIASDAAKFLFELHNAIPVDVARDMGVKEIRTHTFADQILPTIPDHFPNDQKLVSFARKAVSLYQNMKKDNFPKRVLHWDLHNGNMILDENYSLKGVIDFGDVEIGDIHADFHPLYKFDTDIAQMALRAYEQKSNLTLSFERVKVYAWINELSDIVETIGDPTNHAYQKSMERVVKWMNE